MIGAFISKVELSHTGYGIFPENPFKSKTLEYHVSSTLESKQETVDMYRTSTGTVKHNT
jgi:predicted CoA-binding protein